MYPCSEQSISWLQCSNRAGKAVEAPRLSPQVLLGLLPGSRALHGNRISSGANAERRTGRYKGAGEWEGHSVRYMLFGKLSHQFVDSIGRPDIKIVVDNGMAHFMCQYFKPGVVDGEVDGVFR